MINRSARDLYDWPLEVALKFSFKYILLLSSVGLMLIALGIFLPIGEIFQIGYWRANIVRLFIILLGIILDGLVIYQNLWDQNKVIIDDNKIYIQRFFKKQSLSWGEVTEVVRYQIADQDFLGFATQKMMNEASEAGFLTSVNALTSGYSELSIPLDQLQARDKEEFVDKIQSFYDNYQNQLHREAPLPHSLSPAHSNWLKGLGFSFVASFIFGGIYGLILFLINVNVVFVPFLGVYVCHYYLFRSIKEEDYKILSRLWIALMGINQIIMARMIGLWGNLALTLNIHNMYQVFVEYFLYYLPKYGMSEVIWGVLLLATMVFGFLTGPSLIDKNRK